MPRRTQAARKPPPRRPSDLLARARLKQAITACRAGQLVLGRDLCQAVLESDPRHFDALSLLGLIAIQTGRHEEAIDLFDRAIAVDPRIAVLHANRGLAQRKRGAYAPALASYDRAIALKPDLAEAHLGRGIVLKELGRVDEALGAYDRAIALRPDSAEAHCNRGIVLHEMRRLDDALASFDEAIALKPGFAEAYSNRGVTLHERLQLSEAVASYDKAIALRPDHADAHWNKALTLLLAGDFEQGLRLYEWRWRSQRFRARRRHFSQPLWLGEEPVTGETVLLHGEQGLGDTIQFCRYATRVHERGARVILDVQAPLAGLLRTLDGVATVVATGDPLPPFDRHCPLLSLPLAFRTTVAGIPAAPAYLRAAPAKVAAWTETLGPRTGPRIGIVWSGSATNRGGHHRSLALATLLRHLPRRFRYVSLQKELREADRETLDANPQIRHFGPVLRDFTDTAALCALMDRVISIDTSVAHLSAALGRPTAVLLPHCPDWRWMREGTTSPWYPTARLYRQARRDDWESVLDRIAQDLVVSDLVVSDLVASDLVASESISSYPVPADPGEVDRGGPDCAAG